MQTSTRDDPNFRSSAAAARQMAAPYPRRRWSTRTPSGSTRAGLPGPAAQTVTVATATPWSSRPSRHRASAKGDPAAIAYHFSSVNPSDPQADRCTAVHSDTCSAEPRRSCAARRGSPGIRSRGSRRPGSRSAPYLPAHRHRTASASRGLPDATGSALRHAASCEGRRRHR